jgi:hypothetical protein
MRYAYLAGSSAFLLIWLALWWRSSHLRRMLMLRVSAATALLGLLEPYYVPEYWHPPTLFDLTTETGFDIESVLFSFSIGGIATAVYGALRSTRQLRGSAAEPGGPRHVLHGVAIAIPVPVIVALALLTPLNPIVTTIAALSTGVVISAACRPDLVARMLVCGLLFLGLYFVFFALFNVAFPGYIDSVWNLPALSGVVIAGVPVEELSFGFVFGLMWSSVAEYVVWATVDPST